MVARGFTMYGMMFVSWLPVIPASMLVVFLFVSINVLYRALSTPPGLPRDGRGVCGACGYALGTLEGHRCSECGADLLRCGVLTKWMLLRARGSTVGAIAAWSVLWISVSGTALAVWGTAVMMRSFSTNGPTMTPDYIQVQWIGPPSAWDSEQRAIAGDDLRIGVEYTTNSATGLLKESEGFRILLEHESMELAAVEIDEDGGWVLIDDKGKKVDSGEAVSIEMVDRIYAMLGTQVPADRVRGYADQSWVYIQSYMGNMDFNSAWMKMQTVGQGLDEDLRMDRAGTSFVGGGAMAPVFPTFPFKDWAPVFYVFLAATLVYVAGVVFIVRRRARIMRGE